MKLFKVQIGQWSTSGGEWIEECCSYKLVASNNKKEAKSKVKSNIQRTDYTQREVTDAIEINEIDGYKILLVN